MEEKEKSKIKTIFLRIEEDEHHILKYHCLMNKKTLQGFFLEAIREKLKKDGANVKSL